MVRHVGMISSNVKAKSIKVNRFHVSSFDLNGVLQASVIDTHLHSHVYYRPDSKEARKFVKDYAKSLNASYKYMPEPYGNIIGGSRI